MSINTPTHLRLPAQLEHGEEVERGGAHVGEAADLLGDHPVWEKWNQFKNVGRVNNRLAQSF